jgi:hypothetical protein
MYRWLRNIHLAVGVFTAIFLLVFGATAMQMAYRLPGPDTTEATTTIDVPAGFQANPRAFAWWLMERHGMRGDLTNLNTTGAVIELSIMRTGALYRVEYDSRRNSARVTTFSRNTLAMLDRIHHARGIAHEYWAINAWGWMLLTTSCALLVLAITGIVMWFKRHEDRVVGAMVTTIGLVWGVTLLALMRLR